MELTLSMFTFTFETSPRSESLNLHPDVHHWHARQSYSSLSASSSSTSNSIIIPIAVVSVVVMLILGLGIARCLMKAQVHISHVLFSPFKHSHLTHDMTICCTGFGICRTTSSGAGTLRFPTRARHCRDSIWCT